MHAQRSAQPSRPMELEPERVQGVEGANTSRWGVSGGLAGGHDLGLEAGTCNVGSRRPHRAHLVPRTRSSHDFAASAFANFGIGTLPSHIGEPVFTPRNT